MMSDFIARITTIRVDVGGRSTLPFALNDNNNLISKQQ